MPDGTGSFTGDSGGELGSYRREFQSLAVGDVDGDGFVDIITGCRSEGSHACTWLFLNTGTGSFVRAPTESCTDWDCSTPPWQRTSDEGVGHTVGTHSFPSLGDFDGDGDLDVVIATESVDTSLDANLLLKGRNRFYENRGRGTFFYDRHSPHKFNALLSRAKRTYAIELADLDNDGDVGLVGSAKPMPVVQDVAPTRPAGLLGTLRANCTALWSRAKLPILKYKKQRAHMVFPVVGPHKEQAMVSVECVKRPGGLISTPFGYYDWKLLSIDFADNTYYIYRGDEERYNRPLISQLRRPMVEWMMSMAAIEDHEEIEDEAERLR